MTLTKSPTETFTDLCGKAWDDKYFQPQLPELGSVVAPLAFPRLVGPAIASSMVSGQASQAFASADFDGDGNPDNAYLSSAGVVVELMGSEGSVLTTTQYPVGFTPTLLKSHIIAADFNGDGNIDLAVSNLGNVGSDPGGISILLGNGDGTFAAPKSIPAGFNPLSLVAADFNGDGKLDIAVANQWSGTISSGLLVLGPGTISILSGNGDGTFAAPVSYPTGEDTQGIPVSIVALDLNGDGLPDLAVANRNDNSISTLLNAGGGKFRQPAVLSLPYDPGYLAYADFNHDGNLDLVATAERSNAIVMLAGKGDGSFQNPAAYATGNSPVSIGIAPLADGNTFLITADGITGAAWFTLVSPNGAPGAPALTSVGGRPTAVAVADLNGDGQPDVVIAGASSAVSVLTSQGGKFKPPVGYSLGPATPGPRAVAIGDLNGDGKPDVVVANSGNGAPMGSISVLLGNGDGSLKVATSTPVNQNARSIALGDFNGDGKLDVAVAAYGSTSGSSDPGGVVVLLGKGDGTFQTPLTLTVNGMHPQAVAAADLNGDGKLDLAVLMAGSPGQQPATLAVFLGQGNGTFASAQTFPVKALSGTQGSIAVGDLNGDGKLDIVTVGNFDQTVYILFGDGAGGFRESAKTPSSIESGAAGLVMADLDGDGNLDLVIPHCCGQSDATFLLGNGDGTFQGEQQFLSGIAPTGVGVTKFGRDTGLVAVDQGGTMVALALVSPVPATGSTTTARGPAQ